MPTGYKIEISPNNRAACKSPACTVTDEKIKILKGEIRFASLFQVKENTSWAFKHWGCVTPDIIRNVNAHIEGEYNIIEGWEELDADVQEKVIRALTRGTVDDEDWRGDPEYNQVGMHGMFYKIRKPRRKKDPETGEFIDPPKEDQEDGGTGTQASEPNQTPTRKQKKDLTPSSNKGSADFSDSPVPKKSRRPAKKRQVSPITSEDEAEAKPPALKRRRKHVKKEPNVKEEYSTELIPTPESPPIEEESDGQGISRLKDEEMSDHQPKIRKKRRTKAVKSEPSTDEPGLSSHKVQEGNSSRARKGKAVSKQTGQIEDQPVRRSGRGKRATDG